MAVISTMGDMTLLELAKQTAPDGGIVDIIDVLSQKNEILQFLPWTEANGNTTHTFSQALTEPAGTWAGVNEYVSAETGRTRQVVEGIRTLKTYVDIDVDLLAMSPNKAKVRANQAGLAYNGLTKELVKKLIYGNDGVDPDTFTGLAVRPEYDAAADTQVLDVGGSGSDTMSVWIVKLGVPNGLYMAYPKGNNNVALQREDKGEQVKYNSTAQIKYVMREEVKVMGALCIGDPRAVVRLASIESAGSTNLLTYDWIIDALSLLPDPSDMGGVVMLGNRTAWSQLWKNAAGKANVNFDPSAPFGQPVRSFDGIPFVLTDQLTITETAL
jgi:hypothetical protein